VIKNPFGAYLRETCIDSLVTKTRMSPILDRSWCLSHRLANKININGWLGGWFQLVPWLSGRTLVFDWRAFAVLRSTYSWRVTTYVAPSLSNVVSTIPVRPPGILCHLTYMTLLTLTYSKKRLKTVLFDRTYWLIIRVVRRSWAVRRTAPYKSLIVFCICICKPSAIGQPTRPTQPFILSRSINE